jgi:hypothetical protein
MTTPRSMGGLEVPLDPNNPYRQYCRQDNFVEFGPLQLLSLLAEPGRKNRSASPMPRARLPSSSASLALP